MAEPNILQKVCRIGLKVIGFVSFLAPLLSRLVVGYTFYGTGHGKVQHLDKITNFFDGLGIPLPHANAVFVSYLEYIGGMLLIVGLFTRPISALLGATMIVALMTADKSSFIDAWNNVDDKGLIDINPFVLGMLLLWLLMYGPGLLSIDALIRKVIGVDKPDDTKAATTPPQTPA